MRVTKALIKSVVGEIAGEPGVFVANTIISSEEIAEEDLAIKMGVDLKFTRHTLYKLQKHNLVFFKRKKNERTGWYTYFWSFKKKQIPNIHNKLKLAKFERLKYRLLVEETTQFFTCENSCLRMDFEKVMDQDYKCPECGSFLNAQNNKSIIKQIKKDICCLESELKEYGVKV
jgi:transcription initiation factor TFIIE subunit alpha